MFREEIDGENESLERCFTDLLYILVYISVFRPQSGYNV